jgi:hypothetical protein
MKRIFLLLIPFLFLACEPPSPPVAEDPPLEQAEPAAEKSAEQPAEQPATEGEPNQ